ncbi:MAG TPA: hypothetical protein VGB49_06325, partial [Caulobacteraceae bacterium]
MSRLETVFAPAESLDADRLFKLTFGAMLAPLWAPVWTVAALRAVADWAPARGSETLSLAAPEPVVTEPVEAPAAAEPATLVPAIEADVTRY